MNSYEITVAGFRSPVLEAGDASSPEAIVYLHGNPGSSEDYRDLIERSGAFARSLAMDMPGFGRADKGPDFTYNVDAYGDHLHAVLSELNIKKVYLVVHDFGGPWGLNWAVKHPEMVAGMVLINTGLLLDYSWHAVAKLWRMPLVGELFMLLANRFFFGLLFKVGNPRGLPEAFVNGMFANFDSDTRRNVLKLYRATNSPSPHFRADAQTLAKHDIPALVVWGKADPYLPFDALAEKQKEGFPSAEIHSLDDSGHWPFVDNPDACANIVIPWLRKRMG